MDRTASLPDTLCVSDVERTEPQRQTRGASGRTLTRGETITIAAWLPCTLTLVSIAALVLPS